MTDVNRSSMHSIPADGMGASFAVIVFALAYFALAFGDTMLLAPSRAVADIAMDEQGPLAWSGAAAHLAMLDVPD